jgi:hypothetical protein
VLAGVAPSPSLSGAAVYGRSHLRRPCAQRRRGTWPRVARRLSRPDEARPDHARGTGVRDAGALVAALPGPGVPPLRGHRPRRHPDRLCPRTADGGRRLVDRAPGQPALVGRLSRGRAPADQPHLISRPRSC